MPDYRIPVKYIAKTALSIIFAGLLLCSCGLLRTADETIAGKSEVNEELRQHFENAVKKADETEPSEPDTDDTADEIMEYEKIELDINPGAVEWREWYDSEYGAGASERLILDGAEIEALNREMCEKCPRMHDMSDVPDELSGEHIINRINRYSTPSGRYHKGKEFISDDEIKEINNNLNLDGFEETVTPKKAVIVKRCNLRGFPTDKTFHSQGDEYYDGLQETELIMSFPVLAIHESRDSRFTFVLSYFYDGWIPTEALAYCTDEEYMSFVKPEKYVTAVSRYMDCSGHGVDMGTVLKYTSEDAESYTVSLPIRGDDGWLEYESSTISKKDAVKGHLEYTTAGFYRQAFEFIDTDYDWGGANGGVDCSGFVCAVFRSFGIYLPRNASEQGEYAGTVVKFNKNTADFLDSTTLPTAIYQPGHVMLYLGKKNGSYFIIHAPKGGEKVCVVPVSVPGKLTGATVMG